MKNPFKRKHSRVINLVDEKNGVFDTPVEIPESELLMELRPSGEFLETDEDLGYC